jgi:hypothetical protein
MTFLAELTQHVHERRTKSAFFYGRYSNASRGKRKRDAIADNPAVVVPSPSPIPLSVRKRWARLIAKIYHVNPLICTRCGNLMKITDFIFDPQEIEDTMISMGIELTRPHNNSPPEHSNSPDRPLVYERIEQALPTDDDYLNDC